MGIFVRIVSAYEQKVLVSPNTSPIYKSMMDKYNDTSFPTFAQYVLDVAKEQRCRYMASGCRLDEHIRSGK